METNAIKPHFKCKATWQDGHSVTRTVEAWDHDEAYERFMIDIEPIIAAQGYPVLVDVEVVK